MARRHWNDGQEITLEDLNAIPKAIERAFYDRVIYEMLSRKTDAFFQDSLKVNFASNTQVTVLAGLGFYNDSSQANPEPTKRPLYLGSNATASISTPDPTNNRIDLIVATPAVVDDITATRKFKDAIDETVSDQSLVVQKDWQASISVVEGTPSGSPVAPSVPAGSIKLAEVLVTAVTGISGSGAITDAREKMPIGGDGTIDTTAFNVLTASGATAISTLFSEIDTILYKQKEFDLVVAASGRGDHTTLAAAIAAASAGDSILCTLSEVLASTVVINKQLRIVCKNGVEYSDGGAGTAFQIDADNVIVEGAKFTGLTAGILVQSGRKNVALYNNRFTSTVTTDIDDQGTNTEQAGNIKEVV